MASQKEELPQEQQPSADMENIEAFEASAFEALEKDFQEVLAELLDDESLKEFREQYERLHDTLKQSHDSEKMLITKCRELSTEIVENAYKVQRALRQSQEDQATIKALKKEIEKAWKIIEESRDKEQTSRTTIEDLRAEVANMSKLVERSAETAASHETREKVLTQQRVDLVRHRDILAAQVEQLQAQSKQLEETRQALEADCEKQRQERARVDNLLKERLTKFQDNIRQREQLDAELRRHRETLEDIGDDSVDTLDRIAETQEEHKKVLRDLKASSRDVEYQKSIQNNLQEEIRRVREQSAAEVRRKQKLKKDMKELNEELEKQKKELNKAERAKEKAEAIYKKLCAEKEEDDRERAELLKEKKTAAKMVQELSDKVEKVRRREEADAKMLSDLSHEKELLFKAMHKATDRKDMEIALVKQNEQRSNDMLRELQQWRQAKAQTEDQLHDLVMQRDRFMRQLKETNDRFVAGPFRAAALKEEIAAIQTECMQQKNLYEAVRADRNLYSKNLLEAQGEIADIERKFSTLEHRTKQLRAEIEEKDQELVLKHLATQELTKTAEQLRTSLEKAKKRLRNLASVAEVYREEIAKLEKARAVTEEEIHKQKMNSDRVAGDKELLCTRLVQKKAEHDEVHEKIKLCESALKAGEVRYKELCDEIALKKDELGKLQAELAGLRARVGNMEEYKHEAYQLQQQLLGERAKVKALSDELEKPMNVHRWRELEGSDPEMFHMLEKMRNLQRRLISRTEEVVERKETVRREEEDIKKLERKLERIPGPELQEQLVIHEGHLRDRNDQLTAMNAELADYKRVIDEYQAEIRRLKKEKQEVMQKYYKQKKQSSQNEAASRGKSTAGGQKKVKAKLNPNMPRYTGGGFCLTST
ncbi:hypothetical protein FOZ61_005146 [Perkinsus olseni]|uniref:Cilia- and flagella-associated protein 58 central coiled coil domain-containing protein n=1 Tax=Perkinsus olseni TaxID=32597 RepID=A0A7J6MDD3_PEROL|nr:hypothetical protein FOZ61_005146 [Perkinsus olseni]